MMKKLFLPVIVLIAVLAMAVPAQAQVYKSAIGARLGYPLAASYKTFFNESSAVEVYVGFRNWSGYGWFSVSGAYQKHAPINGVDGLQWYWGLGASAFFWNFKSGYFTETYSSTSIGLQGYLGLDYKFANAPVSITADWIPTFFVNGYGNGFGGGYGTLGVRYVLN